jgi:hypothetical protein
MKRTSWLVLAAVLSLASAGLAGCTTLGPMPATTGIAAVPAGRPGVELQAGVVPGYVLSSATQDEHEGGPSEQLLALVEPDRWLGTRGLIVGAREVGREGDFTFEPFVGYRHRVDERVALAVIGHAASMGSEARGASYDATRGGGEIAADLQIIAPLSWLALHGQAAVSATYLQARGTYCVDDAGLGIDCNEDASDRTVRARVDGWFPAATASLALDLGRRPSGPFHGARIALLGTAGAMPQLRDGIETDSVRYLSMGLTLTLGVGDR